MLENILKRAVITLLYLMVFSILISLAITSARYVQKFSNTKLLKKERVSANELISYSEEVFLNTASMIKNTLNEFISGNGHKLNQSELYEIAKFGYEIGNDSLEFKASRLLLGNNFGENHYWLNYYKEKYLFEVLYPSIHKKMEQNDYENARYRAQRFVNYYDNNPDLYQNFNNRMLMYARKTIKNIANNYLYNSKEIIKLVDHINWYDDFRFITKKEDIENSLKNAIKSVNPNLQSIIRYALFDIKENTLQPIEKVDLWDEYIKEYPDDIYTAEAYFNQIIALFSIQLQTLLESEKEYTKITKRFYKIADIFLSKYIKSYLTDDALYYSIVFSGLDRNEKVLSYLKILVFDEDNKESGLFTNVFHYSDFDYFKFITDAIQSPMDITFDEFVKFTKLDSEYLRPLKRELYRLEGKNYGKSILKNIIVNIVARNLGGIHD